MSTVDLTDFTENDEWDTCFNALDEYDREQELIAKSNAVDETLPKSEYLEVLNRCFGHKSFRPMQWKIISSIINDRRDNCSIMATGYGKSLCFQYPSVYIGGITIVVSPLIALMEDQVLSLTMSNISACLLGTAQNNKRQVIDEIFENKYSLIYVTPELACGDYGHDLLRRINRELSIILIAIDEAHCVSSWGHDFRYQYRQLGHLRDILPDVPILAVTATATPRVRNDIISTLKLKNPQVLCSGFDRPNLQFFVNLKGVSIMDDLKKVMSEQNKKLGFPGSTIIYCITRKQTEEIATLLQRQGIKCLGYHAGMSLKLRKEAHENFVKDKVKIIVATIAFGMGIDKPDVRNIIHYGASKDIESYYQEVGRAGRDGQPSNCVTFYKHGDFDLHDQIQELNGVSQTNKKRRDDMQKIMIQYLQTRDCRRQFILNHFEGSLSPKKPNLKCCDNCTRKLQEKSDSAKYEGLDEQGFYDFTNDAHLFLETVDAMKGKFGMGMYILLLRGSKSTKLYKQYLTHPLHGKGKYQSEDWWKGIGRLMESKGFLSKDFKRSGKQRSFNTYSLSEMGRRLVETRDKKKLLYCPTPELFQLLKRKDQMIAEPEEASFRLNSGPSTSGSASSSARKEPSSKVSLKYLKMPETKGKKSTEIDSNDSISENGEVDLDIEDRMKLYRLLMNKRSHLASSYDCMPYMVASNEALMKMAQSKPITIKELRDCRLDGFTEAKINRFGEQFVKEIRIICHLEPTVTQGAKRIMQDILAEHPLPGAKMGATAEASYSMYKLGLTVQEISTKRGLISSTVLSHLIDAIKMGYPIKLIDLNITDEMRDTIISVIKSPPINNDVSMLTPIKDLCPAEVTSDIIKVVAAYLSVRLHLETLGIPYEEFETPMIGSEIKNTEATKKRDAYDEELNVSDSFEYKNPPHKKLRISMSTSDDLSFLDSPPRQLKPVETVKSYQLDESILEDDFFDGVEFDDMDMESTKFSQKNTKLKPAVENESFNAPLPQFMKPQKSQYNNLSLENTTIKPTVENQYTPVPQIKKADTPPLNKFNFKKSTIKPTVENQYTPVPQIKTADTPPLNKFNFKQNTIKPIENSSSNTPPVPEIIKPETSPSHKLKKFSFKKKVPLSVERYADKFVNEKS